jgi:hypothetical protein
MSGYLTDLADVVRRAGLVVQEEPGWQTRARSSGGYSSGRPTHVMVHHTASGASSDGQPDVNYMCYSSENKPVANLYLSRSGKVWIMAAGATNTNGKGGPIDNVPADSMNTYAIGIEAGNNGVGELWPMAQQDAYLKLVNALKSAYGISNVRSHWEYAPGRKIDPAGSSQWASGSASWNMDAFRASLGGGGGGGFPAGEETGMLIIFVVTDGKTPYAQYVTNGMSYRHLVDKNAADALSLFMGLNGMDTKVNQINKSQLGMAGIYVGDDGTFGAANPYV